MTISTLPKVAPAAIPVTDLPPLVEQTPDQIVLRHLDDIVKEYGADYRYPHIHGKYAVNGKPACLIGVLLHRLGMSIEDLDLFDSQLFCVITCRQNVQRALGDISNEMKDALSEMQYSQDHLKPWGYCVDVLKNQVGA